MTLPATFDPLVDRIYEVLCDGAGSLRALALADRYSKRTLPNEGDERRAKQSRVQKIALVGIDSIADSVNTQEHSDRGEYQAAIRVDLCYHTPNPYERAAVITAMTDAHSDAHLVRAALGWGANMTLTADARETGLAGGGLVFTRTNNPRLSPDSRLFTLTLAFSATVWLAFPTT